jgi:hypothetical protein
MVVAAAAAAADAMVRRVRFTLGGVVVNLQRECLRCHLLVGGRRSFKCSELGEDVARASGRFVLGFGGRKIFSGYMQGRNGLSRR